MDDTAITAKIKSKFMADDKVKALNIHVKTDNCNVTLSGNIDKQEIIDRAIEIAKKTAGVKNVRSEIKLSK